MHLRGNRPATVNVCTDALTAPHPKSISRTPELDAIFDPQLFRDNAELVVTQLEKHLSDKSIKGLALEDPTKLLCKAKEIMAAHQKSISPNVENTLEEIIDLYITTGIQVHSPGYMGRQFSSVIPLAAVIDLVSSIVNQPSSFYEAGQLPSVVERIMADELNRFIGWPRDQFAMITTSGGSLANMTAILAARNEKFPAFWAEGSVTVRDGLRPAIAVGDDVHYSISRAAGILGIGEKQIVRLPLNDKKQICPLKARMTLDTAEMQGLKVFCMVASAGTTSTGAYDPIDELAHIAEEKNIWLHIDGAHGGSLLVSDPLRDKLKGIEKADSFSWDAHKMMFVPAMCTLLFYKNKQKSYGAFQQQASYVFEEKPDIYTEFDSAEQNFECTKRPMIMNLWVLWTLYGKKVFSDKIEYLCDLTNQVYATLKSEPDFETIHQPESNILCFRYQPSNLCKTTLPDFQLAIRNQLRQEGRFFISKVDIDGECALRVVFMNHESTLDHFHLLLNEIRKNGQQLISRFGQSYKTSPAA